jgi:uncharacterized protein (DUF2062 family)
MGIVPLWGVQMLIAIAISIYFKLNKAIVLLSSNISFPPFIPVILYLSHLTGKVWMGKNAVTLYSDKGLTLEVIYSSFTVNSFIQYILGAITLAIVAGLAAGVITYLILNIPKRHKTNG